MKRAGNAESAEPRNGAAHMWPAKPMDGAPTALIGVGGIAMCMGAWAWRGHAGASAPAECARAGRGRMRRSCGCQLPNDTWWMLDEDEVVELHVVGGRRRCASGRPRPRRPPAARPCGPP